jgi:hypothetical protein
MKNVPVRSAALLCILSCATVAALELWPAGRGRGTADQNGDGRPDIWRFYDARGRLAEVDVDSNFDGKPDIEEYYERGVLVRRESDRNFNGEADLVEEFDVDTHGHTRSVVDTDYDGTADLLVFFRDDRPVFSRQIHPGNPSGVPDLGQSVAHRSDAGHLSRLFDPSEADTVLRTVHKAALDEGCVGLSTSGGLPCPRVAIIRYLLPSWRPLVRVARPRVSSLPLPSSPRAPPAA